MFRVEFVMFRVDCYDFAQIVGYFLGIFVLYGLCKYKILLNRN